MEKRLQERLQIEDDLNTDTSKWVDFSDWPLEFESQQSALDTYNRLGLPHRIMFKISNHEKDASGISMRFKLICFNHTKMAASKRNI